jgi:hypothetical protein
MQKAGSALAANSRGIKRFLTPTKKTRLAAWCATPCGKMRFLPRLAAIWNFVARRNVRPRATSHF